MIYVYLLLIESNRKMKRYNQLDLKDKYKLNLKNLNYKNLIKIRENSK